VIFREFVTPRGMLHITREVEQDFNAYSQKGRLSPKFSGMLTHPESVEKRFLMDITKGTRKRYVLERSEAPDMNLDAEESRAVALFLREDVSLEAALQAMEGFLVRADGYEQRRESGVAEQIMSIPETTLVIFGAGHPDLERMVSSRRRPTEVHFPYPGYPLFYDVQMRMGFRQTTQVSIELCLRMVVERLALNALGNYDGKSISGTELNLLAHRYAALFSQDQILGYRDYLLRCRRLFGGSPLIAMPDTLVDAEQHHANNGAGDIFESYLSRNGLPPVKEVLARLRGENSEQPSQPAQ
jgi:hypothetical protein